LLRGQPALHLDLITAWGRATGSATATLLTLLVCLVQDVADNQLADVAELRQDLAACSELVCLSLAGNPCMEQEQQEQQQEGQQQALAQPLRRLLRALPKLKMLDGLEVVRAGRGRGLLQHRSGGQVLTLPNGAEEAAAAAGGAVTMEQQQEVQQLQAFMERMGIRSQLPLRELVAAGAAAPAGRASQPGLPAVSAAAAGGILAAASAAGAAGAAGRVALLRPASASRPATASGSGTMVLPSRPAGREQVHADLPADSAHVLHCLCGPY
jgi:hypothetical protein